MNITELKELAEKATGGEWVVGSSPFDQSRHVYCKSPVTDGEESWLPLIASTDDGETLVDHEANAAYIAAANPAAILELIAQLEAAEQTARYESDLCQQALDSRKEMEGQLEDAQGEIRALRATEAGLLERVKELEEGLSWYAENARLCRLLSSDGDAGRIALDSDGGAKARALLEKKE